MEPKIEVNQIFRHQNGHEYLVLVIARDDYTGDDLVIHQGLHDSRVWSRPMANFQGLKNGSKRFTLVSGVEPAFSAAEQINEFWRTHGRHKGMRG